MKKILSYGLLALSLIACEKESNEAAPASPPPQAHPLESYLQGEFELRAIDYDGTLNSILGRQDIEGRGDSTQGYYHFFMPQRSLDYQISTYIALEVLGQNIDFPLNIGDSTALEFEGDSLFAVEDPQLGRMQYRLRQAWADSCLLQTVWNDDTAGFQVALNLELHLRRR